MTTQEIIEVIKGLSVLELNDLVKACELQQQVQTVLAQLRRRIPST